MASLIISAALPWMGEFIAVAGSEIPDRIVPAVQTGQNNVFARVGL